ncbi:skin secretory protein xP2-like [Ictalurus furcatus]|uniref:skin secretory protein xP2-like n=1 Tax=Ictalurus furcatus TaxID=66913 RepID=UPI00234FCCA7|nr:skin secretory protein xP2-like [Ictalurus furcatus]
MRKQQVAMSAAEEARIWAFYRSSLEMSKQLEEEIAQCKAELRAASSLVPFTPSPPPKSDAVQRSQQSDLSIWGFPLQGNCTMLRSPEVKAGPEICWGGAMRTAELQPEAYGEASAVELPPEVNMATSDRQLEVAEEAVPLPCPAEEAVLLSSPAEEAVPLPCPAEEAAQPSSPAGDAAQRFNSSAARGGPLCSRAAGGGALRSTATGSGALRSTSSAARGGAPTFNPGGGVAPPLCCPTEAASLSVAARDNLHRGPGPPLEGGSVTPRPADGTAARLLTGHVTLLFSFASRLDIELSLIMSLICPRCPCFGLSMFAI